MKVKRAIALGFFDGVHIGHMSLLKRCCEIAADKDLRSAALTFSSHPDGLVLNSEIKTLSTNEQRVEMLRRIGGVSEVLLLPFDNAMMHFDWRDFFKDILLKKYSASHLISGESFRFGYKGLGTPEKLRTICRENNISCDIVKDVKLDGMTVSSTIVKELIAKGEIEQANRFLGHAHEYTGRVVSGKGIGSKKLVPTINIEVDASVLLPPYGVYISKAYLGETSYMAVTNIGVRPTFSNGGVTVETNAIGYSGNAYGETARIELLRYLRPEHRFSDAKELLLQIERDITAAKSYFSGL
ncbi:MAG: bifunctional riboflavin kinase/FAD synthetase [Bacillota bacterium]|nr:bifunctional riboflavin kinase/FAD synthetase [Bacillota bacterium]